MQAWEVDISGQDVLKVIDLGGGFTTFLKDPTWLTWLAETRQGGHLTSYWIAAHVQIKIDKNH